MAFLGTICLVLVATSIAGHLSTRIGVPSVIGQLLVGVLLGPAMLGWVHSDHLFAMFAEIGVIILMFMAGLESDLTLLKKYLKPALSVATLGVIFPIVVVYYFGRMYHFGFESALFLGVIFAATSVSISVEVLKELKRLDSKEGATILGAAVVDDILAVVILSILISMFGNITNTGDGVQTNIWFGFLLEFIYFIGIFILFKWVAPFLMRLSERLLVGSSVTIMSLVICLGMAYLADLVGLSAVIGAFFAGIAVAQTPYKKEIDANIEPIGYAVFIPMFFTSIGLNMSFDGFMDSIWFIVILTILAVLTKLLGGGLGAKLLGFNLNSAYVIGAGMISRGEMALIIVQIGYEAHLLSTEYYSAVIMVIIVSTILAPFMLKHAIGRQKITE
ncbi:cation:proton antiporter [Dellaglioa sp. L3N]